MDDVTFSPAAAANVKLKSLETGLRVWTWVSALIAGIAGGVTHPAYRYQDGYESYGFGWPTFWGWGLLTLLAAVPWHVVFYAIRHVLDEVIRGQHAAAPDDQA